MINAKNSKGWFELFEISVDPFTDIFEVTGACDVIFLTVRKPNGTTLSTRVQPNHGIGKFEHFKSDDLTKEKRRGLVRNLGTRGFTQQKIAQLLGISQATVSKDMTILNEEFTQAKFEQYTVRELESGSIEVEVNGKLVTSVKPALRKLAEKLNVSLLNKNNNPLNTRALGTLLIRRINSNQ